MNVRFRRYEAGDADAVWRLHEWAMVDAGVDPADIPGTEDLRSVREHYLDVGGEFLVGVGRDGTEADDATTTGPEARERPPATADGPLVAMGGYLPNEHGHTDERTVPGAAELHRMRVAPTHQGRGLGRRLLVELEERADRDGFGTLLATTAARQRAAVGLYSSAGYEEVGRSREGDYELVHFEKEL